MTEPSDFQSVFNELVREHGEQAVLDAVETLGYSVHVDTEEPAVQCVECGAPERERFALRLASDGDEPSQYLCQDCAADYPAPRVFVRVDGHHAVFAQLLPDGMGMYSGEVWSGQCRGATAMVGVVRNLVRGGVSERRLSILAQQIVRHADADLLSMGHFTCTVEAVVYAPESVVYRAMMRVSREEQDHG